MAIMVCFLIQSQYLATVCLESPIPKVRSFCGWVVDDQFQPIAGATVVLTRSVRGKMLVVGSVETDLQGYFEQESLAAGQYAVEVFAPGYSSYKKAIVLVSNFKSKSKKLLFHLTITGCPGVSVITERKLAEWRKKPGA